MNEIKKLKELLKGRAAMSPEEVQRLEEEQLTQLAEPYVRRIVDLLAERKYAEIPQLAELTNNWTAADLQEFADGFFEINELPYFDKFDTPCNFRPQYEYHQMNCYLYNDGSGFPVDYDLTTDSELNDLTLQLEFLFQPDDTLKVCFLDLHVL